MGAGHGHAAGVGSDRRYLSAALALLVALMVAEVVVALATRSLALISDAGHMLTDAGALGISLAALAVAARPAAGRWTFGWRRVEILSALASAVVLLVVAVLVTIEAVRRLVGPTPTVEAGPVLGVALAGVVVTSPRPGR